MRCKKCGAVLKKDGDICTKCFNKIQKENILKNDTEELYRIKKKYSPKYILLARLVEYYIIFILLIAFGIIIKRYLNVLFFIIIFIAGVILILFFSKKSVQETYIAFYKTKVVYRRKFLFIDRKIELAYEDIKDIVFTQGNNWWTRAFQKKFNLGNILIYPKKGNILVNGMQLEIVENIKQVIEDIKNVIGDKIK